MEKQIKSKKRVADHGEVFTAEREVNAMLDLVKQETERIDSRFLEPACGDATSWRRFCGGNWQRFGGSIAKAPLITKRMLSWQSPVSTALI